jgi:hypothetical protein
VVSLRKARFDRSATTRETARPAAAMIVADRQNIRVRESSVRSRASRSRGVLSVLMLGMLCFFSSARRSRVARRAEARPS